MKKQIIYIGGGVSRENYKNFFDFLEKIEFNPYEEKRKKWKDTLASDLGEDFEVIFLSMPNKDFADFYEWKVFFEKVFPYLKEDFYLVGHSLGATFLIKYLSENNFSFSVSKIFLLAPAFSDSLEEKIGNFNFGNLEEYKTKYEKITTFLHSKDDFVVPFSDFLQFKNTFSNAIFIEFEDKNHFLDEKFEEFLELIKKSN